MWRRKRRRLFRSGAHRRRAMPEAAHTARSARAARGLREKKVSAHTHQVVVTQSSDAALAAPSFQDAVVLVHCCMSQRPCTRRRRRAPPQHTDGCKCVQVERMGWSQQWREGWLAGKRRRRPYRGAPTERRRLAQPSHPILIPCPPVSCDKRDASLSACRDRTDDLTATAVRSTD